MAGDLDIRDAGEVCRRVVQPVAQCLLRDDELEDISVTYFGGGLPENSEARTPGYLRISIKARGEWLSSSRVWHIDDRLLDPGPIADDLYDALQTELVQSKCAWGELRTGDFEMLPPN